MIYTKKTLEISMFIVVLQLFSAFLVAQNTTRIHSADSTKLKPEISKIDAVNLNTLQKELKKAKQNKNVLEIANVYDKFSEYYLIQKDIKSTKYADSIIQLTSDLEHNEKFPALGYQQKGRFYYRLGKYNLAFNNFIKALNHAKENTLLYETINFNIGLIKNTIKRPEQAKKIFKQYVNFLETDQKKEPATKYNLALFALSHSLTYTGQLDSAAYYIDKGIKNCIAAKDENSYSFFVLNSGINSYYSKNFKTANDSLLRAKELFTNDNRKTSLAFTHLYLGKNNLATNKNGIKHFIKVDSILEITKDVMPGLLEIYDDLKKHYRSKRNNEKLLYYMDQELKFRNIFTAGYEDLVGNIVTNYDNRILQVERDETFSAIRKRNSIIIVLLSLLLAFAGAIYYFFRKQVIHKKRFYWSKIKFVNIAILSLKVWFAILEPIAMAMKTLAYSELKIGGLQI